MVLEHVNRLQRPIVSRKVEVSIYIAAVLPVWRKAAHALIDGAFLDPKTGIGAQLQIQRIIGAGDFVRTVSESNLNDVQNDVRTRFHMQPEIMESFSPALPAVRV